MIQIALAAGFILILMGLYGALTNRDIIRMIIGFTIADAGVNIVLVSVGNMTGRTAPIRPRSRRSAHRMSRTESRVRSLEASRQALRSASSAKQ